MERVEGGIKGEVRSHGLIAAGGAHETRVRVVTRIRQDGLALSEEGLPTPESREEGLLGLQAPAFQALLRRD
eukprot:scaffold473_cov257-Pinguiococcus_pyrenoidosus.AAC.14